MSLSKTSEPVLAVLSAVAGTASAAALAGTTNPAAVPHAVTGGLSVASVATLALGWFIRRYTTTPGAHSVKADAQRVKAEVSSILAEDPATATARVVRDALAVAEALHPMGG